MRLRLSCGGWARRMVVAVSIILPAAGRAAAQRLTAPPAPTGITVTGTAVSATVTWQAVAGAASYSVQRWKQDAPDCCRNGASGLTGTTWADNGGFLQAGIYVFQVSAVQADGRSAAALVNWTRPNPEVAPSGAILPLSAGEDGSVGSTVALRSLVTTCRPLNTLPGPGPSGFTLQENDPGGPKLSWPQVPGAIAWVVERSVDGSGTWTEVGSTCGGPSPFWGGTGTWPVSFSDRYGGIAEGTTYVYKVAAIGESGQRGWNSTRWTAPRAQAANWLSPIISGSTVTVRWGWNRGGTQTPPLEPPRGGFTISTSYGFRGNKSYYGTGDQYELKLLGVPEGTHTVTVRAKWNSGAYRDVAGTITVKP